MSTASLTEGGRSVHSEDWGWRLQPRDPEPRVLPGQGGQQRGPPPQPQTARVQGPSLHPAFRDSTRKPTLDS